MSVFLCAEKHVVLRGAPLLLRRLASGLSHHHDVQGGPEDGLVTDGVPRGVISCSSSDADWGWIGGELAGDALAPPRKVVGCAQVGPN